MEPATKRRAGRSGLAALASSVVPGWGQSIQGRKALARAMLAIDLVVVTAAVVAFVWFEPELLAGWFTPGFLLLLLILNVVVFSYRGAASLGAFAGERSFLDWIGMAVASVVVVVPHVLLGWLTWVQYDVITTVFPTSEATATPATTSTTSTSATTTTFSANSTSTSAPTTTTTEAEPTIWDGQDRLNILLLGSDAGVGRIGTRTDTMLLVSIEPNEAQVAMFSIPRNLSAAPLPDGMGRWSCNCFPDILTHLWANGEWYPEAFPGPQSPSVNGLKAAVSLVMDMPVHYYAKVDLRGFVDVVDALGGVFIDVPETIWDETYPHEDGGTEHVVIEEGFQLLDGHHVLAYSRIRRHSGDFARMHRQRCVLGALVRQTGPLDVLAGYPELATAVKEFVETDIPLERLPDIVQVLARVDTRSVVTLRITRYNYGAGGQPGQQFYDLEAIKADAHALLENPLLDLNTLDGTGLDATCEESFD